MQLLNNIIISAISAKDVRNTITKNILVGGIYIRGTYSQSACTWIISIANDCIKRFFAKDAYTKKISIVGIITRNICIKGTYTKDFNIFVGAAFTKNTYTKNAYIVK